MITESQQIKSLCVALPYSPFGRNSDPQQFANQVELLIAQSCVARVLVLHQGSGYEEIAARISRRDSGKVRFVQLDSWLSGRAMARMMEAAADGLLLNLSGANIEFERRGLEKFLEAAEASGAGIVYSDSRQIIGADIIEHPRINYQLGSVGDAFDFGPVVFISKRAAEEAINRHGDIGQDVKWAGFYDLRLKVSIDHPIVRLAEALYVERVPLGPPPRPASANQGRPFYVQDRGDRQYQIELEKIATDHLRRIGAYLESGNCAPPATDESFPVTASIIIPTRNRERLIGDAIQSAVNQIASFDYNVIVVIDHSTDSTSEVVEQFAREHKNVVHIIPERKDLGVGGLWNEAIYSRHCGLYAVQLDSDDVYAHERAVEALVNEFKRPDSDESGDGMNAPRYAMVVGSYRFVDFDLKGVPPGVNQRLELSRENGRNNLLFIEGPGAPRAYYVPVLRRFGFPNVSFGEDYAVALRIGREYDTGRVFEPIYLARQWEGNTSRSLPLGSIKSVNIREILPAGADSPDFMQRLWPIIMPMTNTTLNRNNGYKDYLRTVEIQARINRNRFGR